MIGKEIKDYRNAKTGVRELFNVNKRMEVRLKRMTINGKLKML